MKVPASRSRAFVARPDPAAAGFLIFGPDPLDVDDLRVRLTESLARSAERDVSRIDAAEARRDPAALADALRSGGLFGGAPLVVVDSAADGVAEALSLATADLTPEQGAVIVTAGNLPAKSKLRKLFESQGNLAALAVYPQTIDRPALTALLNEAACKPLTEQAEEMLLAFAAASDASELRAVIRTLALYAQSASAPVPPEEVAALLPSTGEGESEPVVLAAAARRPDEALEAFARTGPSAATPVALALGRHFRTLHALASAPDGPDAAAGRMRPPLFGPRRDALTRAARGWPPRLIETALEMILDAEFALRSTGGPPDRALVERLLVRVASLRPR